MKQYFKLLQSNRTIPRLIIEEFIGDIRMKLAAIDGIRITAVHPEHFTGIRNGREQHSSIDIGGTTSIMVMLINIQ